ncbi:MAG: LTA synthase family protein [Candidatus Paceibacterota bacterium]|jgi:phosphoglycerol transferase MdoB-like AlkP superfamily enzyme
MKRVFPYVSILRLPAVLAGLFVAQNHLFNSFVHLSPNFFLFQFIFITFSLGMLLYAPAMFFKKFGRFIYLIAVSLAVAAVFISQYLYFLYFGGFMQASALKYANQAGAVSSTISVLITPAIAIFLLQFFVIFAWVFAEEKKIAKRTPPLKKEKVILAAILVFTTIFSYGIVLFGDGKGWNKITHFSRTIRELNSFVYSPNNAIERTGIFNYYAGDVIGYVFRKTKLTPEDIALVEVWEEGRPDLKQNKYFGAAKGKNLIIIQVESLENAVLFQKIDSEEITPNLNKLAKEGLYFDNYYTQVGPGNTADAEFVTMNSLYSLPNTVAFIDFAHNTYNALPSLLKQNGYHTYSLHADVPTFWNRSNIYPGLGYEKTYSKADYDIPKGSGFEYMSDGEFFTQSQPKMSEFASPYLATFITLSSHTPFVVPEKWKTLRIPENAPYSETQKNYLQSIHYTDMAIGDFIAALKTNDTYKNSLIAIYGDHGNLGGISEAMGTSTSKAFAELRTSNVPLIILNSSLPKKTYHLPGSHLDFYPTVANLLGVTPTATLFGQDLVGKSHRVTIRNAYSRAITAILEETLAYKNFNETGTFENGECLKMPEQTTLPLSDCQKMYEEELAATNASDLIIKGNLISKISNSQYPISNN